jgi:hypothetical protein
MIVYSDNDVLALGKRTSENSSLGKGLHDRGIISILVTLARYES